MAPPATSAITMAFAAPSPQAQADMTKAAVSDTLQVRSAVAIKQGLGISMLTPPNSVSPNLPAHMSRAGLSSPPPMQIDTEIDLQDAVDHAAAQDQPPVPLSKGALAGLDASHTITAVMLAKHHLPGIMLGHGPVAIRHIMGCLAHTLPGFSRIAPTKARRLVVAALEHRGGGGVDGDIVFEKVGWGRWDAYRKGQRPASAASFADGKMSPPASEFGSYAMSYDEPSKLGDKRTRRDIHNWMGTSMPSSYDEHLENMSMPEDEADKMSLDDSSENEDDSESTGDETEDEDWDAVGVDALRKASLRSATPNAVRTNYNLISIPGSLHDARRLSAYSSSVVRSPVRSPQPATSAPQYFRRPIPTRPDPVAVAHRRHGNNADAMDMDQTTQEREAIEALLRMGSM